MTSRFTVFYLAAAFMAWVAACTSTPAPAGTPPSSTTPVDAESIVNRQWVLDSLELNGQAMTLNPNMPQTVELSRSGKITGSGGCNSYFADYVFSGVNGISFSPIGATKMACAQGMAEESQFFEALASIDRWSLGSGAALELQSADGQTVLTFVNPAAASGTEALVGKVWVLAHIYSPAGGAQIDPASAHAPTIEFRNDGKLAGRGGCNQFYGAYELGAGNTLDVKDLGATLMACADMDAMNLETAYFEALNKADSYTRVGNELQLSSAEGSALLTFTAQTP